MKFIHLSDLHLGKRVNGYSMLEDQEYILNEIKAVITAESPDAVLIAGDVYDKPVPPAEAVRLFDDFLVQLSRLGLKVFVISGNHDSPERIAFGSRLMNASGIYLSPVYDGTVTPVSLHDAYGVVDVYMLPFIKPAHVRRFYETETEQIQSYTDAMQTALSHLPLDHTHRNVLITHQFVTDPSAPNPKRSPSAVPTTSTLPYSHRLIMLLSDISTRRRTAGRLHRQPLRNLPR